MVGRRENVDLVEESGGRSVVRGVDFQGLHVAVALAMLRTDYCHIRVPLVLRGSSFPSRGGEDKDGNGNQARIVYIM